MGNRSHDTKGNIRARAVLSFLLFVMIVILSISICGKAFFVNASYIEKKLDSYNYSTEYRTDIAQYTEDIFVKNGIPADNVKNIITQETAQGLTEAYINSIIKAKVGYTADTVGQKIDEMKSSLKDEIKAQLKNTDYKYNDEAAGKIVDKIGNYADERLTIPASNYLEALVNIAPVVFSVILGLSAFLTVGLVLIIYFLGAKRYRSVRAIGISFMTAGFYDLILSLIVVIISKLKTVDIFPLYLRSAFMSYVNGCIGAVAVTGAILLLISLVIITIVWKMKRNEK
ncbi:MAG: hypothetical protein PUE08_06660 [Eubacteriales bacterium]|nr:hypothetical protein [Eubacteriales bacterium]